MSRTQNPQRLAFIQARWHADIVDQARAGLIEALEGSGIEVDVFDVPGAFEIPLLAQRLARADRHEVIAGCAFVVDGGIYRHDFVASTVVEALMRVQLDEGTPVLSVVLTPHHFQETEVHRRFFLDHFRIKGAEAARAALAVLGQQGSLVEAA